MPDEDFAAACDSGEEVAPFGASAKRLSVSAWMFLDGVSSGPPTLAGRPDVSLSMAEISGIHLVEAMLTLGPECKDDAIQLVIISPRNYPERGAAQY